MYLSKMMIVMRRDLKMRKGKIASQADLFATVDGVVDADGNIRDCTRLKYVLESNANGGTTEIITLDELLSLLGTTRDELEASEPINVEYLMDEQYSKRIMVS